MISKCVAGLFVALLAACGAPSGLSGLWTGTATSGTCTSPTTIEGGLLYDQQFHIDEEGAGATLLVTWRDCNVVATTPTEDEQGQLIWSIASQACYVDGIDSAVHGEVRRPSASVQHLGIRLFYRAVTASKSCENYVNALLGR
jgi:hypothetical protein